MSAVEKGSDKKRRRYCVFNSQLQEEFKFLKKTKSDSDLHCNTCGSDFSIAHSGRTDIEAHIKSDKHKKGVIAASSSKQLTDFFKATVKPSQDDLETAAREGVWAYHLIDKNENFRSADCSSKIFRNCFGLSKYQCARTKCEAIITNVFSPFIEKQLIEEMNNAIYVSIITDASNHGHIKMFPVLVRYFAPLEGIKTKILNLTAEEGETSDIIVQLLKNTLEKFNIAVKMVSFCADNTNTNFGGKNRGGKNNVYYKIKSQLNMNLFGVGCAAHICHNCLACGCNGMPFDVESILVKIYSHFYRFTVRVANLKEFCQSADVEYQKILGYGKTRFLEMFTCVNSILRVYDGLKAYFLETPNSPRVLKDFFKDQRSKLWLIFLRDQVN